MKMKKCKTLKEFKEQLQKAIDSQSIEKFKSLVCSCPFVHSKHCSECQLYEENGPEELVAQIACLRGSMSDVFWHYENEISKETAIAMLILESTKLLAYLDSKE